MTSRFSALLSSVAFVKLKDPVIIVPLGVLPSKIIILLWAMACLQSIKTVMPLFCKNLAPLYCAV